MILEILTTSSAFISRVSEIGLAPGLVHLLLFGGYPVRHLEDLARFIAQGARSTYATNLKS
jgi:hypothetical protein